MVDKRIEWKVEGMDCTNCAKGIQRFLERKGMESVFVDFASGEVQFIQASQDYSEEELKKGVSKMGYIILEEETPPPFWSLERKLLLSAFFTLPLFLDHIFMMLGLSGFPFLHSSYWVQFFVCLPVFIIGAWHFGGSALGSLKAGILNMDVLIFMGSTAAFVYSFIGTLTNNGQYIFYETAATIITLVLVGNLIEKRSVQKTTSAIDELSKLEAQSAQKIMPSGTVVKLPIDELSKGDILLVNSGDAIPTDGKLIEGEALVDESLITGESTPILKQTGAALIGASILLEGPAKIQVTATGKDTLLSKMIQLVKEAQREKPDIQKLADKISGIFVPAVLGISVLTLLVGHFGFNLSFQQALMNAIAVLVISCPCAMGLATPTAVTVGVGRMARNGILVRGGQTLETFAGIRQIVFDKTGTLTTGKFEIENIEIFAGNEKDIKSAILQLEQASSHPIARSLVHQLTLEKVNGSLPLSDIQEFKGKGMQGLDGQGNIWKLGSAKWLGQKDQDSNGLLLSCSDKLIAKIMIKDQLRSDAKASINYLKDQTIKPILLSGDQKQKTATVASTLGVNEYHAEHLPEEKLDKIAQFSAQTPTAMVGDGINDAPALAKATIGVSLSDGSQVAIQSAQIILLDGKLGKIETAHRVSTATLQTIKQNLFWAFSYNLIAIPIAAMGFLTPMWGALFMAFSDVVVIGNSLRLRVRKV